MSTCRIQSPDIQRAGPVGAAHGGAAGRGTAGQDGAPTDRFAKKTIVPRALWSTEDNCPERPFGDTDEGNRI